MGRRMTRCNGAISLGTSTGGGTLRKSMHQAAMFDPLTQIFGRLSSWPERSRQRFDLEVLPDRVLRDIGISRADMELEIRKPFRRP